jgi:hypothetical protein
VGYKFSLVLSREITDDESAILQEAGCASAIFATDSLPTNAEITVTKMDFDDMASLTLAEAIESALEAVKTVPDLTVPGLTVPAQPAERPAEEPGASEPGASEPGAVIEGVVVEEEPAAKKTTARKPRKTSVRKVIVTPEAEPALVTSNGHSAPARDGSDSAG